MTAFLKNKRVIVTLKQVEFALLSAILLPELTMRYLLFLISFFLTTAAFANAQIIKQLAPYFPDINDSHINKTVIDTIYEVNFGSHIIYISQDGKYLFQGDLIDLVKSVNLTQTRKQVITRQILSAVPNIEKITYPADNQKYVVDIFTDIDCPYCRQLHQSIKEINALGITINYLFFPRAGIDSNSYQKAVSVWCSDNQKQAMDDAKQLKAIKTLSCDNPVLKHLALIQQLGINATPTMVLADGSRINGLLPAKQLLARIETQLH